VPCALSLCRCLLTEIRETEESHGDDAAVQRSQADAADGGIERKAAVVAPIGVSGCRVATSAAVAATASGTVTPTQRQEGRGGGRGRLGGARTVGQQQQRAAKRLDAPETVRLATHSSIRHAATEI
jgi:hypothetical protein